MPFNNNKNIANDAKGGSVSFRRNPTIGKGVTIRSGRFGHNFVVGDESSLGDGVKARNNVNLGENMCVESGVQLQPDSALLLKGGAVLKQSTENFRYKFVPVDIGYSFALQKDGTCKQKPM